MNDWQRAGSDKWVLDKLLLSDRLGYECGPAGCPVSSEGDWVVRPAVNINGMGAGAFIEWLWHGTDHLLPGTFWCEMFDGPHISVDYAHGEPVLSVEGRRYDDSLQHWHSWRRTTETPELPGWLQEVADRHEIANAEFVGGRVIEFQFHHNSDFRFGNDIAIPVYDVSPRRDDMRFVEDRDGQRIGLYIG